MKEWHKWAITLGLLGTAAVVAPRWIWFGRRGFSSSYQLGRIVTGDGRELAMAYRDSGHGRLVIVAHGFLDSMNRPPMIELAQALSEHFDVLLFDARGHGRSTGVSRLDFAEVAEDLSCVLQWAQRRGYERIGLLGYSMGGAGAILAAAQGARVSAVASVCSPAAPRLRWLDGATLPTWPWRWWARLMGTRLARTLRVGCWPIDCAATVSPIPLLVVHHGLDPLVQRQESEALFAAAQPPKEYLYIPQAWHADPAPSQSQVIAWLEQKVPLAALSAHS